MTWSRLDPRRITERPPCSAARPIGPCFAAARGSSTATPTPGPSSPDGRRISIPPGPAQFTHWKNFFAALPWYDLVPDQSHAVVTAGLGKKGDASTRVSQSDYLTAAKTADGAFVIAYMPTPRTITVNMAALKGPATAKWFDPTSGTYTPITESPLTNVAARQFTPPGKNHDGDWVLLLDASGGNAGGPARRGFGGP